MAGSIATMTTGPRNSEIEFVNLLVPLAEEKLAQLDYANLV